MGGIVVSGMMVNHGKNINFFFQTIVNLITVGQNCSANNRGGY